MKKIVLLLSCLLSLSAGSAYALRCGNLLVSEGDHKSQVLRKCGEPIDIEERVEYRLIRVPHLQVPHPQLPHRHRDRDRRALYDEVSISVNIEEWTYNFGPHRFMQFLRFENGILTEIRDLDWGFQ